MGLLGPFPVAQNGEDVGLPASRKMRALLAYLIGPALITAMTEKHPKRPRDLNQWAKRMVDIATGEVEDREPTPKEQGKDPAAVARDKLVARVIQTGGIAF